MLIEGLLAQGRDAPAHDPVAIDGRQAPLRRPGPLLATTPYEALEGADALFVVTEWNEFRHPDFDRMQADEARPSIFDGRNIYDRSRCTTNGFTYFSRGRPAVT